MSAVPNTEHSTDVRDTEHAKWKMVNGHKIVTQFWAKPIPSARWDWSATEEEYDYGRPIGTGATEQEAIDDLLEKLEGR
jgi:hypothetical protein